MYAINNGFSFFLSALLGGFNTQFSILDVHDKNTNFLRYLASLVNIPAAVTLGNSILVSLPMCQAHGASFDSYRLFRANHRSDNQHKRPNALVKFQHVMRSAAPLLAVLIQHKVVQVAEIVSASENAQNGLPMRSLGCFT